MSKIGERGFTLVETLIALAIAGVLVAIAVPSYKFYVARTQVTESLSSASMHSFNVGQNLQRGRCTTVAGVNDVYPNRFGTLTISGTKVTSKGENCPSGCTATFQFNNTTDKALQGKQVVFNILNNQKVSFVSTTINSQEKTALCGFFLAIIFRAYSTPAEYASKRSSIFLHHPRM